MEKFLLYLIDTDVVTDRPNRRGKRRNNGNRRIEICCLCLILLQYHDTGTPVLWRFPPPPGSSVATIRRHLLLCTVTVKKNTQFVCEYIYYTYTKYRTISLCLLVKNIKQRVFSIVFTNSRRNITENT